MSEKDGWRHVYRISGDNATTKEVCITKGNYDVMDIRLVDEKNNYVYFLASPTNATQKYLYKTKLDGKGKLELVYQQNFQVRMDIVFLQMENTRSIVSPTVTPNH